jgi:DNA polymerase-3 subunit beta
MAGAVERVALFATEGEYSIIKMSVDANELTITSSSPDVGTGREVIGCATEGGQLNVAFNSRYILDILKNLESEEAVFSMNTALSPVCVKSAEEEGYTYIVTPVRVVF